MTDSPTPSRQDWQGATDDEINSAIKNCELSIKLSDGRKKVQRTELLAVHTTLLWVMNAVKNPHPLE